MVVITLAVYSADCRQMLPHNKSRLCNLAGECYASLGLIAARHSASSTFILRSIAAGFRLVPHCITLHCNL